MKPDELSYETKKGEGLVCENEYAFCIICREPLNDAHVMVIPKRFVEELHDLTPEEAVAFLSLVGDARERVDALYSGKATVFQNNTDTRTQPRLHLHVLPVNGSIRHAYNALTLHPNTPPARARQPIETLLGYAARLSEAEQK